MRLFRTLSTIGLCASIGFAGSGALRGRERAPEAVEFVTLAYAVGDVVHSTYHSSSSLHTVVLADGKLVQEFDAVEDKSGSKTVRVLATDARGPVRLRIEYGVLKAVQQRVDASGGAPGAEVLDEVDERNPLQGRTFTLQREGRVFRVLDENDARVAEGLARLVLEEEGVQGDLFLPAGDRVARELAGKRLPIGVDIPLSQDAARGFIDGREGVGDLRFVVTPKEPRDADGVRVNVFAVRYTIQHSGVGGEADTTVDLLGEMCFEAGTGRFLSIQLDGLLTLESVSKEESRTVEVMGQGPWSIHESASHEHPH